MNLAAPVLDKSAGVALSALIRTWMGTQDFRVLHDDPLIDPVVEGDRKKRIYIFWHEYILCPLYLRGHCNLTMLLSRHRDADILSQIATYLGFEYIRGSTSKGGSTAIRELIRRSRHRHLTLTPDGPRGPRRHLSQGPIYLSSKLRLPLILLGIGYQNPWRLKSWDRFAIPKPYSRVRTIISGPVQIPGHLDRKGIEQHRQKVETMLNQYTTRAEQWACSGSRIQGDRRMHKQFLRHTSRGISAG